MFSTVEYILTNLPTVQSVDTKWKVHDIAIDNITIKNGIVAEFGVFSGESINYIAKRLPFFKVYGFDSFNGLPEPWRDGFDKGTFFLENLPRVENNVELVVGLFEETLPEFIKREERPLSYLHIDCDLYSSTKTVFEFLKDRIVEGTVIVFDEYFNYPGWQNGEYRAFQEFIRETGKEYIYLTYNYKWEQVAVKIVSS